MLQSFEDLTGRKFGKLTVVSYAGRLHTNRLYWNCICDCGKEHKASGGNLRSKQVTNCGCVRREKWANIVTVHGLSKKYKAEYSSWKNIRNRCNNTNHPRYKDYGGRGIKLCKRWDDFSKFMEDMGPKPGKEYTVERKNNNKGYTPTNCCWIPLKDQNSNKRNNHLITFNGKTQHLNGWAKELGISRLKIYKRLKRGWTVAEAFTP